MATADAFERLLYGHLENISLAAETVQKVASGLRSGCDPLEAAVVLEGLGDVLASIPSDFR